MKKNKKMIVAILSLSVISMYGCDKNSEKDKINDIDVPTNLILDIKDEDIEYKTLKNGRISDFEINDEGMLMSYNGEQDVLVFSSQQNEKNVLKIVVDGKEKTVDINGYLETVYISSDGRHTLYKTNSTGTVIEYFIMDNKTLKSTKLSENILVSGNMIKFLNNNELIFYGVDIEKKESGIFTYSINSGEYKLKKKIVGSVISYIDVLDENSILYSESIDQRQKLCVLNLDDLKLNEITDRFERVEDSIICDNKIYVSAQENYKLNLYEIDIDTNKVKRLTFDFPESLALESKLLVQEKNIYFSDINGDLYNYSINEKSINMVEKDKGEYLIMNK